MTKPQKLQEYNAILTAILEKENILSFEQFYVLSDKEMDLAIEKAENILNEMETPAYREFKEFKKHYKVIPRVGKYSSGEMEVI